MDPSNDYSVSAVNAYYRTVLTREHPGHWMMGEGVTAGLPLLSLCQIPAEDADVWHPASRHKNF